MDNNKFEELIEYFKKKNDTKWELIKAVISFGVGNSMGCGSITSINGESEKIIPLNNFEASPILRKIFHDYLYEGKKRDFNMVTIIITPKNNTIDFSLDQEKIKEQQLANAKVFSNWVYENMRNRIFDYEMEEGLLAWTLDSDGEKEYLASWEVGVFSFTLNNEQLVDYKIELLFNGEWRISDVPIPDYFVKGILEHHRITNKDLKGEWKEWNKFIVKAPYQFIPLGKEQEYIEYFMDENLNT